MFRSATMALAAILLSAWAALGHHGWGSYDAAKPITITGIVVSSKFENPHVLIGLKTEEKTWTVVLAPTPRMINRGAIAELVGVGKTVSAYGYASTVEKDEMRAERITVDGKTYEMR
jgi:hypothetical protein